MDICKMLDKKYYNLNELDTLFQISIADISYAVEKKDLGLVFYRQATEYLIGSLSNRKFVSIGCAAYEGLIKLDKKTSQQVIKQKSITVDRALLLQMENIKDWSGDYPFNCELPSSRLNAWAPEEPDILSGDNILAFPYPKEKENPFKRTTESSVPATDAIDDSNKQIDSADKNSKQQADFILDFPKIELELKDACILSSNLIELFPSKVSST
jgi:hypothetical protein